MFTPQYFLRNVWPFFNIMYDWVIKFATIFLQHEHNITVFIDDFGIFANLIYPQLALWGTTLDNNRLLVQALWTLSAFIFRLEQDHVPFAASSCIFSPFRKPLGSNSEKFHFCQERGAGLIPENVINIIINNIINCSQN